MIQKSPRFTYFWVLPILLFLLKVNPLHGADNTPFKLVIDDEVKGLSTSQLLKDFGSVYNELSDKIGVQLNDSMYIIITVPDPEKSYRGLALGNGMEITYTKEYPRERLLGIFAHEMGHLLHDAWIEGRSVNPLLNEGFATWLAGNYWLEWHNLSTFSSTVRHYLEEEEFIPLYDAIMERRIKDVDRRDIVYNEWAGFIEYLIEEFGWNKFETFCRKLAPRKEVIDSREVYLDVYHMSHQELEDMWISSLQE